jgi:hypothetical protein
MQDEKETRETPGRDLSPRPLVILYRALTGLEGRSVRLREAVATANHKVANDAAHDATFSWLAARAALQRLETSTLDHGLHLEAARYSINTALRELIDLFRAMRRLTPDRDLRRTLLHLRISLAIAAEDRARSA